MTQMTFTRRFLERSRHLGPLCVGIDPHEHLLKQWGLDYSVDGLAKFSEICVEAFADVACVVKPQVAFYEAFGSQGFSILETTIKNLRSAGVLVIADAKRGDIGSTMAGYATAWLGEGSSLESDAVTVSPWLGVDSLEPVFDLAERNNKGAIVLAATSNPEAVMVQTARDKSGTTLAQAVCNAVSARNERHQGVGNIGVVVGATVTNPPVLDSIGGVILMPGVGAQGGTAESVYQIAGGAQNLVAPNVSRAILNEGPQIEKLQAATRRVNEDFLNRLA